MLSGGVIALPERSGAAQTAGNVARLAVPRAKARSNVFSGTARCQERACRRGSLAGEHD
jgi:hypothetical protein